MKTIAAISTALGNGGIGIVRMSGEDCFKILDKIFKPKNNSEIKPYSIKYGHIYEGDNIIDEVLVSYFVKPKSYTTENMCEINSHGSNIVLNKILQLCLKNGAILAEPGEFTKKAFLNGRIDLSQAESVIDIINSKSEKERQASVNQLEGFLSKEIKKIKNDILSILTDIEASIDYPEYDIEEVTNSKAISVLNGVKDSLCKLEETFENGKIIKNGIKTAIIGTPNVGKSSLLNTILKEDRAIVSQYEGTTRDSIEEDISVDGVPLRIVDTAGIRNTDNEIEKIGIKKSRNIADCADLIIAIFDASRKLSKDDYDIIDIIKDRKAIILINKRDIENKKIEKNKLQELNKPIIEISALNREGINDLYKEITNLFKLNEININNEAIITNIRHLDLIRRAKENVINAINTINSNMPIDIISINIKDIIDCLNSITGESTSEDIINDIFSKFCLGK